MIIFISTPISFKEVKLFLETKNPKISYRNTNVPAEKIKVFIDFLNSGKFFNVLQKVLQKTPFPGPNSTKENFFGLNYLYELKLLFWTSK